jgi:uncharacterized repeat protein (TIGR03803 family)
MSYMRFARVCLMLVAGLLAARCFAQTYSVLYTFTGGTDGSLPIGSLSVDAVGNLYGATYYNNGFNAGAIFELSPMGKLTVLHDFGAGGMDGSNPEGGFVWDSAGNQYGSTTGGGSVNKGVIFKLDRKNNFSVFYNFSGGAGGGPGGLSVFDEAGNTYGIAAGDSPGCEFGNRCDFIFKLDPSGNQTVLHTFSDGKHGRFASGSLILDAAGNLYGAAGYGGHGRGLVFKLDPTANESVLYEFNGKQDGKRPNTGLVQDAAGNFYGTTIVGGNWGCDHLACGVVYKLDANGNETVLHAFTGRADGGDPNGVIVDAAGNLYGTAFLGGAGRTCCGVVFKIDPSGNYTVLHAFAGGADGELPEAGLVMDAKGNLYGATAFGGNVQDCTGAGGCGVVFKITP